MIFLRCVGRYRVLLTVGIILALCHLTSRVWATYRADFFDTSHRPTITFDKSHLIWTLRNQSVERIVHFDTTTGGLQTLELRDLHTHHALHMAPGGEGAISFSSPLIQVPSPLPDWKFTTTDPGSRWMANDFDDRGWKGIDAHSASPAPDEKPSQPHWYRAVIPTNRLKAGHAYALYLPIGVAGEAEVYCDGALAQKYPTEFATPGRPEQVDLPTNCRSLAIKSTGASPLPAYISEVGTSPVTLSLKENWTYTHHAINVAEDNSQILTIHLSGSKQYEGFEIDISYQIYAGEEPTVAKWFTFVSHRKARFLMDIVLQDRWLLPENWDKVHQSPPSRQVFLRADSASGDLLMTGQVGRSALPIDSPDGKTVASNSDIQVYVKPETPMQSPRSLTAFWHGSLGTGAFLHQLFYGQYVVEGTPTAIPIAYDTRYAYHDFIDAELCNRIVPLAAAIGSQAFVLDDGWQSNGKPETGRYGDWQADKNKFPMGILPVSTLVRVNHMRFGLWIDLDRVDPQSQAAIQHPDWLYTSLPSGLAHEDDSVIDQMCFTGVWAKQFSQSLVELSRGTSLTYLKARFHLSQSCMATGHDHPVGRSAAAEEEARLAFHESVTKATPGLVEVEDPLSALYWRVGPFAAQEQKRVAGWLDLADLLIAGSRRDAEQIPADDDPLVMPSFTLMGEAFCHLPTEDHPTRDQLDFLWSYVAATAPGFEIQGDLEKMTDEERESARRWITWADQNRDWLAFTQTPTITTGRATDKRGSVGGTERVERAEQAEKVSGHAVRGLLHLRNALRGRYGYLCLWNQNSTAREVTISFQPSEYFVRVRPGAMSIVDIEGNRLVSFTQHNGIYQLSPMTIPPYSHLIVELKSK